jgi:uncharacterized protein (TIGR00251 family)
MSVSLIVHLTPRSSANRIKAWENGRLLVSVTAPPVDGAANKALTELLSSSLGFRKSDVRILSGETSRTKRISIDHLEEADVLNRIQEAIERSR